jgi:LytS/YehU family sensor histidine kinase
LDAQLARARLQTLRMQLHPHFLFNTLHSIAALVRENHRQAAIKVIAGLGDLLRQTLDHAGAQEVTLKQELEFLEKYLDIEQLRFQDRLHIRIDVQPAACIARVPYLILQPLVENAIRHGISRSVNASILEIRCWLEEGKLNMQVRDDGPGLELQPSGGAENIGVRNTKERLEGMYHEDQRFSLKNAEGGGAVASITIPYIPDSNFAEKLQ